MLMHCVSHRGRRDLQSTASVLASRAIGTNKHDYGKLRRLMRCSKGTIELVCYLGATSLYTMISCVYMSYVAHPNFKSQTGATTVPGIGVTLSQLGKQKLSTRSSTKLELASAADRLLTI